MLTGPSRSIFSFSRTMASSAVIDRRRRRRDAHGSGSAAAALRRVRALAVLSVGLGVRLVRGERGRVGHRLPRSAPAPRTSASTASSDSCSASTHACAMWPRSLAALACSTSSSPTDGARLVERRREPRESRRPGRRAPPRRAGGRLVGLHQLAAQLVEVSDRRRRWRDWLPRSPRSAPRGARTLSSSSRCRAAMRSSRSRAASSSRADFGHGGRPRARPAPACSAPDSATRPRQHGDPVAALGQAALQVRQPLVRQPLLGLERGDRGRRLLLPGLDGQALLAGLPLFERDHVGAPRVPLAGLGRRAPAGPRARRAPSPADAVRPAARPRRRSPRQAPLRAGPRRPRPSPAGRARPRRATRRSRISRRVARMPRDSTRAPPATR